MEPEEVREKLVIMPAVQAFVLRRILDGDSLDQIAKELNVSEYRIKQHVRKIYKTFNIGSGDRASLREQTVGIMYNVSDRVSWKDWIWPTKKLLPEIPTSVTDRPLQIINYYVIVVVALVFVGLSFIIYTKYFGPVSFIPTETIIPSPTLLTTNQPTVGETPVPVNGHSPITGGNDWVIPILVAIVFVIVLFSIRRTKEITRKKNNR